LNRQEEIDYFKKYGVCPYLSECSDSVGCNGDKDIFKICRGNWDEQEKVEKPDDKIRVQFT
jgi:hypothetical protein